MAKTAQDTEAQRDNPPTCSLFILFRPSQDWMRPTHAGEDSLRNEVYKAARVKWPSSRIRVEVGDVGRALAVE